MRCAALRSAASHKQHRHNTAINDIRPVVAHARSFPHRPRSSAHRPRSHRSLLIRAPASALRTGLRHLTGVHSTHRPRSHRPAHRAPASAFRTGLLLLTGFYLAHRPRSSHQPRSSSLACLFSPASVFSPDSRFSPASLFSPASGLLTGLWSSHRAAHSLRLRPSPLSPHLPFPCSPLRTQIAQYTGIYGPYMDHIWYHI